MRNMKASNSISSRWWFYLRQMLINDIVTKVNYWLVYFVTQKELNKICINATAVESRIR